MYVLCGVSCVILSLAQGFVATGLSLEGVAVSRCLTSPEAAARHFALWLPVLPLLGKLPCGDRAVHHPWVIARRCCLVVALTI